MLTDNNISNIPTLRNSQNVNVVLIDNDYQMIDAHIDKGLRKKILAFEYVDLSKLLNKNRAGKEEENRLEFVTRQGVTFLAPVGECEGWREGVAQINSYLKWEQAFRVYSNILTTHYPAKVTELLQYNHTIHTASTSYVWENVYSYDKEFQHHISRHPYRAWNIILQQAWTMLLKDWLKHYNNLFQKGNHPRNKKDKEPCRRFN